MTSTIWLNGKFEEVKGPLIDHNDGGYLRGLGIFDTLLGDHGEPIKADEHFARLLHDCKTCLLHEPDLTLDWFEQTTKELIQRNGLADGHARVRTQITVGQTKEMLGKPDKPAIMMTAVKAVIPEQPAPIHAHIISDFPRIANCVFENSKRLNYTRSYIAKHKAIELGGNEAILTNTEGNIACATTSSLFIVEDGTLFTPPLSDGVLNGITRRQVIKDYQAKEEAISVDRLMAADSVILTNSMFGIRMADSINRKIYSKTMPYANTAA